MSWREVEAPATAAPARSARLVPVVAPLVVAALLWAIGLPVAAVLVVVVAVVLLVLGRVRPGVALAVERALAAVGRVVGHVLTIVLLGLVEVVVFAPLWLLARLVRRDPLVERGSGATGRWSGRHLPTVPVARRPFAPEAHRPSRGFRVAYLSVRVVGWVVIVAALNYGLGWLWDEWFGTHEQPVAAAVSEQSAAELAASPAMAGDPWARDYWEEVRALDHEYHPYLLSRVAPVDGRYIEVVGAERRSFEPEGLPADAPEVWFLGGGALWGEGQRDDHTIPSKVARLAAAAGTPIRAVNLGQPGYTSWQSALLLEQELAVRPAPDLVVFYDGVDDVAVQLERASTDPSHYNVDGVTEALTGRDSAREQAQDWWESYRETSVVNRLVDRLQGLVGFQGLFPLEGVAGAQGRSLADRVVDLHARSVDLAAFVAGEHDVPVLFTWQAAAGVPGDGGAYRRVVRDPDTGPAPVLDLSDTLDGADPPVYLDGVLTNERGAALVAASLWPEVRAALP